ncbi:MAG: hypothetical protein WCL00_15295, partial [Bacteroidota bacterium]
MSGKEKTAFIFPAFLHEYPAEPFKGLSDAEVRFLDLLKRAALQTRNNLAIKPLVSGTWGTDELTTQYHTFCYSCTFADLLSEADIYPDFAAGYSMGIYAALYHSKAITFDQGINLITAAHQSIQAVISGKSFGMASVIGLSRNDILSLTQSGRLEMEITNQNSEFALVVS